MSPQARMLTILFSSPGILLLLHAVIGRMLRGASPQLDVLKSIAVSYMPVSLLLWFFVFRSMSAASDIVTASVYCFVVCSSVAYTYFHFFNTSETARRIRILYEIYRTGMLHLSDILGLYRTIDVISLRLERLLAMNQLSFEDGCYRISGRTLYYAALTVSLLEEADRV